MMKVNTFRSGRSCCTEKHIKGLRENTNEGGVKRRRTFLSGNTNDDDEWDDDHSTIGTE